jgi:hypothetical protein
MNRRARSLWLAGAVVVAIWLLTWAGFVVARQSRMTAEKFRAYAQSVDLSRLQAAERERALRKLADKLNALPPEERRIARGNRDWEPWFKVMSEAEKESFIEATFPTGVKQMITAFEKLPEDKRKRTIDEAVKRMREDPASGEGRAGEEGRDPAVSPELEAKIRTVGLKTFFAESSAQTKAEVAPLLEEMQRVLESGGRPGRR